MRRFKKLLASLLAVAMLASIGVSVMASDVGETKDYVVTYSAEEVTDLDSLIEMAKVQNPISARSTVDPNELSVKQLLEVREYRDGSTQEEYAQSTIVVPRAAYPGSQSQYGSQYGVSVASTAYFTRYIGDIGLPIGYVVSRIDNAISHSSDVTATRLEVCIVPMNEWWNFNCSIATTQSFTSYNSNSTIQYPGSVGMQIQNTVFLSNGSYVVVNIMIN